MSTKETLPMMQWECECKLTFEQSAKYEKILEGEVNRAFLAGGVLVWPIWHASKEERLAALVKTIGGKVTP